MHFYVDLFLDFFLDLFIPQTYFLTNKNSNNQNNGSKLLPSSADLILKHA